MSSFLERLRHSQLLAVGVLSAITGLYLYFAFPLPLDEPLMRFAAEKTPAPYRFFVATWTLFLFTTPAIAYATGLSLYFLHVHNSPVAEVAAGALPAYKQPEDRESLYITLGELHHPTERKRVAKPTWLDIPDRGLYTGIACFGAIGSGKTSSFIRPVADQLFRFAAHDPARRVGGLILEVKGDFCAQVREILVAAGREEDYVELSLSTPYRYNPLANPDLDEDALAFAVTTLIGNVYGRSKDPFWPMASTNAMKFMILLSRLLHDYVTLLDVYQLAIDPKLFEETMLAAGARLCGQLRCSAADVVDDEKAAFIRQNLSRQPDGYFAATYTPKLEAMLAAQEIPFERRPPAVDDPVRRQQLEAVDRWYRLDWQQLDPKLRTSIVESVSAFLSLFDTSPDVRRIFCPPQEVFDPDRNPAPKYPLGVPFPPFSQLIEEGRVVALNFPLTLNPTVAKTVGTLLKLDYQRAVLMRVPKMAAAEARERAGGLPTYFRPTALVIDEYQNFVSVGQTGTGDQNFFALARQPRCIGLVSTQSIVSLKDALGSDDAYRTLLQTFRTKVFLNTADETTADFASKLCGKQDKVHTTINVSEASQDAGVSVFGGRTVAGKSSLSTSKNYQVRMLERFPIRAFTGLKTAQAIVIPFDGVNPIPPTYCYLKPYWLPMEQSWWEQYERGLLG